MIHDIINNDCYKLNITNYCNNNCICCNIEKKNFFIKNFFIIINEIKCTDKKNILIYGGEPTIHPDFFRILNYLSKKFNKIFILTNAKTFNNDLFFKKIIKYNVEYIVKINAFNKNTHDKIANTKNSFDLTIKSINLLLKFNQKVHLKVNINEHNFDLINKLYLFVNKTNIDSTIFEISNNKKYNWYKKKIDKLFSNSRKKIYFLKFGGFLNFFSNNLNFLFDENPNEICIEVTARCNLSCTNCFNKLYYSSDSFKKDFLSTKDIKMIIDKIPVGFVNQIRITGGEPLLREDIYEIFDYINKKGFKIWLNTNATIINNENAKLISKYVDNVLVSLNGYNNKSELNATGYNYFDKKIDGIKYLIKNKIKKVRGGTIITKNNITSLNNFYLLVLKLGLDDWELYRPISNSINNNVGIVDYNILFNKLGLLNKIFLKNFKIANALPLCINEKAINLCNGAISDDGHIRFIIGADGIIRPSYFLFEKIGDIFLDNVIDLWNFGFLKKMRNYEFVDNKCIKCSLLEKCKGGSKYYSKLAFDNYHKVDPLINYNYYKQI
jgi:AdoMet-dependent heme synthase